jgi:hypothetical protein
MEILKIILMSHELYDGHDGAFSSKCVSCSMRDHIGMDHNLKQNRRLLTIAIILLSYIWKINTNFVNDFISALMGGNFCILRRVAWSFTLVSCQVVVVVNVDARATKGYAAATDVVKPPKVIKDNTEGNKWPSMAICLHWGCHKSRGL